MTQFDINVIVEALPLIEKGLFITLLISLISSVLAFILGIIIVFIRNFANDFLKSLCKCYVEFVRNIPLLILLYIFYKGLPSIGFKLSGITCGICALSLYSGAFISEVLRAGVSSIAKEQIQASKGLGLNSLQTFIYVVFPQAIRIVIPPLGSQFISLVKNSSLVSFIAVTDLFYVIYKGAVDDFRIYEFFITGAVIYMSLTGIIALITHILEYKFKLGGRGVRI